VRARELSERERERERKGGKLSRFARKRVTFNERAINASCEEEKEKKAKRERRGREGRSVK